MTAAFDVIIVGAGAAGCVLAKRLSGAIRNTRVVAGGRTRHAARQRAR